MVSTTASTRWAPVGHRRACMRPDALDLARRADDGEAGLGAAGRYRERSSSARAIVWL